MAKKDKAFEDKMAELFDDLPPEETIDDIKADRDALRKQLADMTERMQRSQRDNLTLTKQLAALKEEATLSIARAQQQMDEKSAFALEGFVKEMLPVLDNLERGLAAIPPAQREEDPKFKKIAQGFEKTIGQLSTVFNKFGIQAINPKGEAFNPDKHEAISTEERENADSDTVLDVAQKGYEINGRIIRHAKVIVQI